MRAVGYGTRLASLVREQGVRRALQVVARRLPLAFRVRDRFIWMHTSPTALLPRPPLPEGMELHRGRVEDLPLLEQIGASFGRAREFLDAGHDWWLVRDDGRAVFSTWIFRRVAPFDAAPQGWMALPEGVVNLEDSITAAGYRGRGILGAAVKAIFDELAQEGVERVIAVVQDANTSSRRGASKSQWQTFAVVDTLRYGLVMRSHNWRDRVDAHAPLARARVVVQPPDTGSDSASDQLRSWLADAVRGDTRGPRSG